VYGLPNYSLGLDIFKVTFRISRYIGSISI